MPVVMLIAIVAVLVGVYFAATGRGGEMAYEHVDHPPLDLGPVSATDVALLRPPTAMWGYNMQVTDEALDRISRAMRERDIKIAYLEEQLAALERQGGRPEPQRAYARPGDDPGPPEVLPAPGTAPVPQAPAEAREPTQPSAVQAPHDVHGPQGPYDTHDWWAEQEAAAREERARHEAAAEEQGW